MWNTQKIRNPEIPIVPDELKVVEPEGVDFDRSFKHVKVYWPERLWWKIENCWKFIIRIPREIKWFFQRAIRGWADCDTWCFDWYLAKIISQGLKRLKKHKMGFPAVYTEKQWDEIIDCIIKAFELSQKVCNNELEYVPRLPPESYNDSLWEDIEKIARKYESRCMTREEEAEMKKGFKLFVDNFFSFWD